MLDGALSSQDGKRYRWCPGPESNRHASRRGILSPLRLPISPPGHGREEQYYDTDFEALRPAVKKLGSWWWVGLRWGWVGYLAPCIDVGAASQHRQHAGLLGFETGLCQSCRSLLSWCWRRAGAARFCVGRSACFFPALALHL